MQYGDIAYGTFLERPNRFIARVTVDGEEAPVTVHVKNTGRCRELLVPGCRVVLERGAKHLRELAAAAADGYKCAIAFVIAMEGVYEVRPNMATDPAFGAALAEAEAAGVQVLFLPCKVSPDTLAVAPGVAPLI